MIIYHVYSLRGSPVSEPTPDLFYTTTDLTTAKKLIQKIIDVSDRIDEALLISKEMTRENNYTIITNNLDNYVRGGYLAYYEFGGFIIHRTKLYTPNDV